MIPRTDELLEPPDWRALDADFEAFHGRFASVFARRESREQALKHMRALMVPVGRCNGWQMAEVVGDSTPDRMQHLLYGANWSADEARDVMLDFAVEQLADAETILVVDETGFLKKGTASVGVQRQYSGTAGKIENCQIAVFLSMASSCGHALLDRRLYLPESWCEDADARARAHVPEDVSFKIKPQLALEMLQAAWQRDVPTAWVTGDEVYGNDPALRAGIAAAQHLYVLAVASTCPLWAERPKLEEPVRSGDPKGGRPRTRRRLRAGEEGATSAAKMIASWPTKGWKRLAVHEGEKGPIEYDWACRRVVESRDHLPGEDLWLLARRSIANPTEIAYYLSNADGSTTLAKLVHVAASRYTIEQCFEEAKDDVRLDHYEVRTWPSWHRYITLGMMAGVWLASARLKLARGVFSGASSPSLVAAPPAPEAGEKSPILLKSAPGRDVWRPSLFLKSAA